MKDFISRETKILANQKVGSRTLISLFAGAGGLDLGLEKAGFATIAANEIQPEACETLRRNKELSSLSSGETQRFIENSLGQRCFKSMPEEDKRLFFERIKSPKKEKHLLQATVVEGDIRELDPEVFSDLLNNQSPFCISGGPPCQPFSKAGKQKSLDCTKNGDLFFEFVRMVKALQPKWLIFENVKGLTFTKTDVVYSTCKKCDHTELVPFEIRQNARNGSSSSRLCLKCGSNESDISVASEAGGSLKIILNEFRRIGYNVDHKVLNAADYGAPQIRERLFIVGSREKKEFIWPKQTHAKLSNKQLEFFEDDDAAKKWTTMRDALWKNGHPIFGRFEPEIAKLWVKNVVRPHDEPVTWNLDRPSPTIGAHQGAKLAFAPEGIPEAQLFRQQWHTLGRRQGDTPPVSVEHRYLSDEELLILQTFPRWWYLHGTRMQRAFQIGNAVPPILAEAVGRAVLEAENKYD